jgi:hypothetical protein
LVLSLCSSFPPLLGFIISSSLSVFSPQTRNIKIKKEKKGEWGAILPTVSFPKASCSPKASSFLVGACSSYLQMDKTKNSKFKRGEMEEEKL